jgi:hypothetical protein
MRAVLHFRPLSFVFFFVVAVVLVAIFTLCLLVFSFTVIFYNFLSIRLNT